MFWKFGLNFPLGCDAVKLQSETNQTDYAMVVK